MTGASERGPALLGDIGGTKSRFALLAAGGPVGAERTLADRDYASFADSLRAYLDAARPAVKPTRAALCFACPVDGDRIVLTNYGWDFSLKELARQFGFTRIEAINDFAAVALSVPHLGAADLQPIGAATAVASAGAPIGVIGPGTGLGMAGLVRCGAKWMALPGEGGHATMAAADEEEASVLAHLRRRGDHVSAERVASGPGLGYLYCALCELRGRAAAPPEPAEVAAGAIAGDDAEARDAARLFSVMFGTVAGNLALTLGARGGVYIAGGVILAMGPAFDRVRFRQRFEARGRLSSYLAAIPTILVTHRAPAFIGLAALLRGTA